MPKYIFILGHNPVLSILEIIKTLPPHLVVNALRSRCGGLPRIVQKNINIITSTPALIMELAEEIAEQKYLESLGGTIKIGKIITEIKIEDLNNLERIIEQEINKKINLPSRIQFGFSLYFSQEINYSKKDWRKRFNQLGLKIKKSLKEKGLNSRFIVSHDVSLSSVIVKKERLIDQGFDFLFFFKSNQIYFGQTTAIQDYEEYRFTDYGRPAPNLGAGMLPLKLAKIMINLGQLKKEQVILDPFCGSGTILQEALKLGYYQLIGSDKNPQAIENSKNNLEWLRRKLNIKPNYLRLELYQLAVKNLTKKLPPNSIDAIITEPYLGSPLKSQAQWQLRAQEARHLENLYFQAFISFSQVLKKGGRVIIIFPIFKINEGKEKSIFIKEKLLTKIRALGFYQEDLAMNFKSLADFSPFLTKRQTIFYCRPGQRVYREILSFQKNL